MPEVRSAVQTKPPSTKPDAKPGKSDKFEDIETISDVSGITGIISKRLANNEYTFAIVKMFKRNGIVEKTNFIPCSLLTDYLEMVGKVTRRLEELQKAQTAP